MRPIEPQSSWNPYYLAFARSLNVDPATLYGTIANVNFLAWMRERWDEYFTLRGRKRPEFIHPSDHAAFGRWIAERFPDPNREYTLEEKLETLRQIFVAPTPDPS